MKHIAFLQGFGTLSLIACQTQVRGRTMEGVCRGILRVCLGVACAAPLVASGCGSAGKGDGSPNAQAAAAGITSGGDDGATGGTESQLGGASAGVAGAAGETSPPEGGAGGASSGGAPGNAGAGGEPADACQGATIDPCVGIPRFAGTQTVDANAQEFCAFPGFDLAMADPPFAVGTLPPTTATTRARYQVGWSETALHVFVNVTDATIHPPVGAIPDIINGDTVQIFASPTTPMGPFSSGRDIEGGAFAAIAHPAPGPQSFNARAVFTNPGQFGNSVNGVSGVDLPSGQFKWKIVAGGYHIELQIPWTTTAPVADAVMGFNAALSDDIDGAANARRDYYIYLYTSDIPTCNGSVQPSCDSRNWCSTKALP